MVLGRVLVRQTINLGQVRRSQTLAAHWIHITRSKLAEALALVIRDLWVHGLRLGRHSRDFSTASPSQLLLLLNSGHGMFLLHPFQFIICYYLTIRRYVV